MAHTLLSNNVPAQTARPDQTFCLHCSRKKHNFLSKSWLSYVVETWTEIEKKHAEIFFGNKGWWGILRLFFSFLKAFWGSGENFWAFSLGKSTRQGMLQLSVRKTVTVPVFIPVSASCIIWSGSQRLTSASGCIFRLVLNGPGSSFKNDSGQLRRKMTSMFYSWVIVR